MIELTPEPWVDQAICSSADPESFFPETHGPQAVVKRICSRCPVKAECLQYAIDHRIREGIWGGLTGHQRRGMRSAA